MTTMTYSLVDVTDAEKDFDTVEEAINWMVNIGSDMFLYVSLTDCKGNEVDGYDDILQAYENNNDLWAGDEYRDGCKPELKMQVEHTLNRIKEHLRNGGCLNLQYWSEVI